MERLDVSNESEACSGRKRKVPDVGVSQATKPGSLEGLSPSKGGDRVLNISSYDSSPSRKRPRTVEDWLVHPPDGSEPIDLRKEAEAIFSAFEQSLCRDVVFELHRELHTGVLTNERLWAERLHPPPKPIPDGDVYGRIPPRDPSTSITCPSCGRTVGAARYAPHLDKCALGSSRGRASRPARSSVRARGSISKGEEVGALAPRATATPPQQPKPAKSVENPTPAVKPAAKPAAKPATKPTTKPANKPSTKAANKPSTKAANKPSTKAADKPSTKAANKPSTKAANKPSTKPANEPPTKPANEPSTKPANEPLIDPADKPIIRLGCRPTTLTAPKLSTTRPPSRSGSRPPRQPAAPRLPQRASRVTPSPAPPVVHAPMLEKKREPLHILIKLVDGSPVQTYHRVLLTAPQPQSPIQSKSTSSRSFDGPGDRAGSRETHPPARAAALGQNVSCKKMRESSPAEFSRDSRSKDSRRPSLGPEPGVSVGSRRGSVDGGCATPEGGGAKAKSLERTSKAQGRVGSSYAVSGGGIGSGSVSSPPSPKASRGPPPMFIPASANSPSPSRQNGAPSSRQKGGSSAGCGSRHTVMT